MNKKETNSTEVKNLDCRNINHGMVVSTLRGRILVIQDKAKKR